MKAACVAGTILASFTIQDFGVKAIAEVTEAHLNLRREKYLKVIC
jgi:hypothetical protein